MSNVIPLQVRRSPSHSCIVIVDVSNNTIKRVIKDAGDTPYLTDLIDSKVEFACRKSLRKAVKDRMRITPEQVYLKHLVIPEAELLRVQSEFLTLVGDVPKEVEYCASEVDGELYVYLLGQQPEEGVRLQSYVLAMPTYELDGTRQNISAGPHLSFCNI